MVKKYLGFFLISENFYYFSAPKMDRDIFIIQPDFFFLSEHHRVHMQLCDVHAKFVNTLFVLFVNTFISSEKQTLVINIKYRHIQYTHTHSHNYSIVLNVKCEYT